MATSNISLEFYTIYITTNSCICGRITFFRDVNIGKASCRSGGLGANDVQDKLVILSPNSGGGGGCVDSLLTCGQKGVAYLCPVWLGVR